MSLVGAFRWPAAYLNVLNKTYSGSPFLNGKSVEEHLIRSFATSTISMAFGGIDAPGTALNMLSAELEAAVGTVARPPRTLFNIEVDQPCRNLLLGSECECLFGDLKDFFKPQLRMHLDELAAADCKLSLEDLRMIANNRSAVSLTSWCYRHNKVCALRRSTVHVAGPNCQPFSPQGKGEGTDNTEAMIVFAAWSAICLKLKFPLIIMENSSLYPADVMHTIFGHDYDCQHVVVDGAEQGWPCRRRRFWGVMVLKGARMRPYHDSLASVMPLFKRKLDMSYHGFLVGDKEELLADELKAFFEHLASRKGCTAASEASHHDWAGLLTKAEAKNLRDYEAAYTEPGRSFSLSQYQANGRGKVCTGKGTLYTIIRNVSLHFVNKVGGAGARRPMLGSELALLQGFPVLPMLSHGTPCCVYSKRIKSMGAPMKGLAYADVNHQCGNTQHVFVVGGVLLYAFLFVPLSASNCDGRIAITDPFWMSCLEHVQG
jgi:site-specific DNA-cytosine methylase